MERKTTQEQSFPRVNVDWLRESIRIHFAYLLSLGEEKLDIRTMMSGRDPHLYNFIEEMAARVDSLAGEVRQGAHFMYLAIGGYNLPRVSKVTVGTYSENLQRGLEVLSGMGDSEEEINVEELLLKLREKEIAWPHPYDYFEENPHLITFVTGRSVGFWIGATMVYQLKRAQFESRKLTRALVGRNQ